MRGCLFWAPIIRFMIELALEGVISAIVNLWTASDVIEWSYGEVITTFVSVLLIFSNIFLIPIMAYLMIKNQSDLSKLEDNLGEFVEL